jgi:hypothetical protein
MANFQVLFNGEVVEQASVETVRARLAQALGLDDRKANQLFSGRTVVIRSQLDEQDAQMWTQRLAELGAVARIKNMAPKVEPVGFRDEKIKDRPDHTMRDITAAHLECPRCSHMQLDASHCARCGVDLEEAMKQQRKEDLLIEKKIRELRDQRESASPSPRPKPNGLTAVRPNSKVKPRTSVLGWLKSR